MDEAEELCDRVAVMRDGAIVDSGTPRQLVDRHARWAMVRFTSRRAEWWRDELRGLSGVREVRVDGPTVDVHGDRAMVAHVGAELVRAGEVPDDLWVKVPDLEDAVIGLLSDQRELEPAGGTR
jgi:ABC-2 type transport system ATP-binding protein